MGRWAHFRNTYGNEHREYKFWFGVQSSQIPWACESESYYLPEYDPDAEDVPEHVMNWWKENEESEFDYSEVPEDIQPYLDSVFWKSHEACDIDEMLPEYWDEVNELATRLDVPLFTHRDKNTVFEALDRYEEDVLYKLETKFKAEGRHVYELADLHIKTTICCCLVRWGSYKCHYEV